MRKRCRDPKNKYWDRYGGRGITVDPRWDDFAQFLADIGEKPGPEYSIDRVDNDGPYSPENCRWATWKEQARTKRKLTDDEVRAVRAGRGNPGVLAKRYGVSPALIYGIRAGKLRAEG